MGAVVFTLGYHRDNPAATLRDPPHNVLHRGREASVSSTRRVSALCLALVSLVACGDDGPSPAEVGSIEVTTITTGADLDADGYTLEIDGADPADVGANATVTLSEVTTGDREVRLTGVAAQLRHRR